MIPCVCALTYLTGRLDTLRKREASEEVPPLKQEDVQVEEKEAADEEVPGPQVEEVPRDGQVNPNIEIHNLYRKREEEAENGEEQGRPEVHRSKELKDEDKKHPSNSLPTNNPHSQETSQIQREENPSTSVDWRPEQYPSPPLPTNNPHSSQASPPRSGEGSQAGTGQW